MSSPPRGSRSFRALVLVSDQLASSVNAQNSSSTNYPAQAQSYPPPDYSTPIDDRITEPIDESLDDSSRAVVYWSRKRFDDAAKLQVSVRNKLLEARGPEHSDYLRSQADLACTRWYQGLWDLAEKLQVEVLETRRRKLGDKHADTATSLANLALMYWHQDQRGEAEKLQVEVLALRTLVLGQDNPDTLMSQANLAAMYWHRGRFREAIDEQSQAWSKRARVLGAQHPDTILSRSCLNYMMMMNEDLSKRPTRLSPDLRHRTTEKSQGGPTLREEHKKADPAIEQQQRLSSITSSDVLADFHFELSSSMTDLLDALPNSSRKSMDRSSGESGMKAAIVAEALFSDRLVANILPVAIHSGAINSTDLSQLARLVRLLGEDLHHNLKAHESRSVVSATYAKLWTSLKDGGQAEKVAVELIARARAPQPHLVEHSEIMMPFQRFIGLTGAGAKFRRDLQATIFPNTMRYIQASMEESLPEKFMGSCIFFTNTDLLRFCEDQGLEDCNLRNMFVVIGNGKRAYGTDCQSYIDETWGDFGVKILSFLCGVCRNRTLQAKGGLQFQWKFITIDWGVRLSPLVEGEPQSRLVFEAEGPPRQSIVFAQILAWLASQFRLPRAIECSSSDVLFWPEVGDADSQRFRLELGYTEKLEGECSLCWNAMLAPAIISRGFPLPERHEDYLGLELPFYVMVRLAQVLFPLFVNGGLILKGHRTALIPTRINTDENLIQWHFMDKCGIEDLAKEDSIIFDSRFAKTSTFGFLETARNFVGHWPEAILRVGTVDSQYKLEESFSGADIQHDRMKASKEFNLMANLTLVPGAQLAAGMKFMAYNGQTAMDRDYLSLEDQLKQSYNEPILLYDTSAKRAWLFPEIIFVFHLAMIDIKNIAYDEDISREIESLYLSGECLSGKEALQRLVESLQRGHISSAQALISSKLEASVRRIFGQLHERRSAAIFDSLQARINKHDRVPLKKPNLLGWELSELINFQHLSRRKEVPVDQKNGGDWHIIAWNDPQMLVFLAKDLGDLMIPRPPYDMCQHWARVDIHADRLMASGSSLARIKRRLIESQTKHHIVRSNGGDQCKLRRKEDFMLEIKRASPSQSQAELGDHGVFCFGRGQNAEKCRRERIPLDVESEQTGNLASLDPIESTVTTVIPNGSTTSHRRSQRKRQKLLVVAKETNGEEYQTQESTVADVGHTVSHLPVRCQLGRVERIQEDEPEEDAEEDAIIIDSIDQSPTQAQAERFGDPFARSLRRVPAYANLLECILDPSRPVRIHTFEVSNDRSSENLSHFPRSRVVTRSQGVRQEVT